MASGAEPMHQMTRCQQFIRSTYCFVEGNWGGSECMSYSPNSIKGAIYGIW